MLVLSILLLITILLFPLIRYFHKQLPLDQFQKKMSSNVALSCSNKFCSALKNFSYPLLFANKENNCNLFHTWGNTHNRTFLSYYVFFVFNRFIGVQTLLVFALSLNNAIILRSKLNFSQVRSKFLEFALRLIFLAKLMQKVLRCLTMLFDLQWIY